MRIKLSILCITFLSNIAFGQNECISPGNISLVHTSSNEIVIDWDSTATSYQIIVINTMTNSSDTSFTESEEIIINQSIDSCVLYSLQVYSVCDSLPSTIFTSFDFWTFGCGSCTDLIYCPAEGMSTEFEWIESVTFGDLQNQSGDNEGYALFNIDRAAFMPGDSYTLTIEPGFTSSFIESFVAYIDYDQNGQFDPSTERVLGPIQSNAAAFQDVLIPVLAKQGLTRLRVIMSNNFLSEDVACDNVFTGEIEDYCIQILPPNAPCDTVSQLRVDEEVSTNEAFVVWEQVNNSIVFNYRYREFLTTEWETKATLDTFVFLNELEECKTYEFQVQTVCPADTSRYSNSLTFATWCTTGIDELNEDFKMVVSPNPFTSRLAVDFESQIFGSVHFELIDLYGHQVQTIELNSDGFNSKGAQIIFHQMDDLPNGIYFVHCQVGKQHMVQKVIKL